MQEVIIFSENSCTLNDYIYILFIYSSGLICIYLQYTFKTYRTNHLQRVAFYKNICLLILPLNFRVLGTYPPPPTPHPRFITINSNKSHPKPI